MDNIIKLLAGFEETAYKILMLVIIIPKTLLKIIFDPIGARKYVEEQLDLIEKNKALAENQRVLTFAEYFSPVLLLLTLALVPALLLAFLPSTGVTITASPVQDSSTQYLFTAESAFSSSAQDKGYQFKWEVSDVQNQSLVVAEIHTDSNAGRAGIIKYDNNKATDTYRVDFNDFHKEGNYSVQVSVMDQYGNVLFSNTKSVSVTRDSKDQTILKASVTNSEIVSDFKQKDLNINSFSDLLEKDTTIFLAFALLLPPLFFAFVYSLAMRKQLTEQDMRKIFYVECYYFSPLGLAIWAFYYSLFFLTGGAFQLTVSIWNFVPPILALVWFVSVETNALADESKDDNITRLSAFFIVVACVIAMTVVGLVISVSIADAVARDVVRRFIIGIYVLISLGLIGIYFVNWRKARQQAMTEKKTVAKDQTTPISPRLKWIAWSSLFIIILCCIVPIAFAIVSPPETSSGSAPEATAIPSINLQDNVKWKLIPFGVSQSKADLINDENDGGVHIKLQPKQDEKPDAYYIYNAEYTNVNIETKAKRDNKIPHSVSLICRSNDMGWYEFEVTNSGDYYIYQIDRGQDATNNTVTANYTLLTSGSSPFYSVDNDENIYAADCSDNNLSLSINNNSVATITDAKFTHGRVGVAVYSPESQEVDVQFAYVTITEQPSQLNQTNIGATTTPIPVPVTSVPTNFDAATATAIPDAGVFPATQTSMPQAQQYFTEEFDTKDGMINWPYFVVAGDTYHKQDNAQGLSISSGNGALTFDLQAMNLWVYTRYDPFEYDNVRIDIQTTNRGVNTNNVSLICRYTETSWYEFNISNGGEVYIYYAETQSNNKVSYQTLFEGGSAAVKYGHDTNEYSAICDGNTLSLYINGKKIRDVTDTKYNLTSGKIGVSVSSFDILPVTVDVDWVKVSKP